MTTIYEADSDVPVYVKGAQGEDLELDGCDYQAETELTASGVFSPQNVGIIEFTDCLAAAIHAAEHMDRFKKALFRKRSREESGLPLMEAIDTDLWQALAGSGVEVGDPIGQQIVDRYDGLFHGIVGLVTETGELAQVLYDFLATGKEPDVVNVREEVGDNLWYISRLIKWAKTTWLTEMRRNIEKLRTRHGTAGFDKDRDINRDLARESDILAKGNWDKPVESNDANG